MKTYTKRQYIDPNNKIGKYIKFNSSDKVICDFIDYVAFYWKRHKERLNILLSSDNSPSLYVWRLAIERETQYKVFTAFWSISVAWIPVRILRFQEIQLNSERYLKVNIYWKWVKLIREEGLRSDVYTLLHEYCWLKDIILTRVDYTVDCWKYNFRKKNSLKAQWGWSIYKKDRKVKDNDLDTLNTRIDNLNKISTKKKAKIQYLLFGNKSSSNARFIRYYDKKAEIIARWTQFLYPEYFEYPQVMRYELQVNSKGFDDNERELKIEDIEKFINFGLNVSDNTTSHKRKQRNLSMFEWIKYGIKYLRRHEDQESIEKIKLLLFTPDEMKKLWDTDFHVLCETSDREKHSERFSKCINKNVNTLML